jgi:hypothetical protein
LWEGGFLLAARAQGVVPSHAHHAIQIVIALDGYVAIRGKDDGWRESRGIIVRPDAEHSFDCNAALGVMVFVDPESSEGAWLSASLQQEITTVPDTRLDSIVPELRAFAERPDETQVVAALVRGCVQALRPDVAPTRRLDSRVTTVLNPIRESDDLRMSLDKAADMACLSPTRFAHLFRSLTLQHVAPSLRRASVLTTDRIAAARPAASCQCGEVCNCGPTCTCKGCKHPNAQKSEGR